MNAIKLTAGPAAIQSYFRIGAINAADRRRQAAAPGDSTTCCQRGGQWHSPCTRTLTPVKTCARAAGTLMLSGHPE
jgi:hypothetical protein